MRNKTWKVVKKILIILGCIWIALVIVGGIRKINRVRTEDQIMKIHATKLTIDDVMGKNLPPDPGPDADKTIAGIDANHNGIRDDVELAIFKAYPKQAKIRSALLQYALAMQLQMTLPFVNKDTVTETVEYTDSRANFCLTTLSQRPDITKIKPEDDNNPNSPLKKFSREIDNYESFVKNLELNNQERKDYQERFYNYLGSFGFSGGECDIDPATLPN